MGTVPTGEEGLRALTEAPESARGRWKGPYLEEALPMDPWGHPYQYAVLGPPGRPYALYSFGADGKRGGEGVDADLGLLPAQ